MAEATKITPQILEHVFCSGDERSVWSRNADGARVESSVYMLSINMPVFILLHYLFCIA
jgi:hypothetical protein